MKVKKKVALLIKFFILNANIRATFVGSFSQAATILSEKVIYWIPRIPYLWLKLVIWSMLLKVL